jgi:hypothetical protein
MGKNDDRRKENEGALDEEPATRVRTATFR